MLTCIPCPGTKDLIREITNHIKGMSLKAVGVQKRRRKSRREKELNTMEIKEEKEDRELQYPEAEAEAAAEGEEEEEEEGKNEWVAEPDPGVLITLVSLPNGANNIRRIRFREELFDAWGAQEWWSENYEKIIELYSITRNQSPKARRSENIECQFGPTEDQKLGNTSKTGSEPGESSSSPVEDSTEANEDGIRGKVVEWVVEDEPGVFITVRSLPDGSNELIRVELSRERFGEVKARVWWEENKLRLKKLYVYSFDQ